MVTRIPDQFAVALRGARAIRGLTLRQLSEESGVPTWRLSSFERGASVPEADEFAKVWGALSSNA
jgi:transcriptional regulator with XRE-family HTH domain